MDSLDGDQQMGVVKSSLQTLGVLLSAVESTLPSNSCLTECIAAVTPFEQQDKFGVNLEGKFV